MRFDDNMVHDLEREAQLDAECYYDGWYEPVDDRPTRAEARADEIGRYAAFGLRINTADFAPSTAVAVVDEEPAF